MDLSCIPGLGKKRVEALQKSGIRNLADLLYNVPRSWLDRTKISKVCEASEGMDAVFVGRILRAGLVWGRTPRFQATFSDGTGEISLTFFQGVRGLSTNIHAGMQCVLAGTVGSYRGLQMVHPEITRLEEGEAYEGEIVPVYHITEAFREAKMEQRFFRKLYQTLFKMPGLVLPNCCPRELTDFLKFRPVLDNLRKMHFPETMGDAYRGKRQLKILELLPFCLRMVNRRRALLERGIERRVDLGKVLHAKANLKFALTHDQETALSEILDGLNGKVQFHALLQGDVGSGKTVVATLAMLAVAGSGEQCALMVPTDILARQHYASIAPIFREAGLEVALLLGSCSQAERKRVLGELKMGLVHAVIGTHALFSKDVEFNSLGLVIIDEQHRFGVDQREALLAKGRFPDLLVLSATPIPRSLAMTLYGDLKTIIIREKPPGRKPVKTRVMPPEKRENLKKYLLGETLAGNQCYWVVSRISNDEAGNLQGLEEVVEELQKFSPEWKVSYVHGQMDDEEREKNLAEFSAGNVHVLVATTVIEVGVNVPNANLMVIDHPERFGLAQLHQLRGRVGRGSVEAWCFLICSREETAYDRLQEFAQTDDGFEIAEMDLRARGAGNLEGSEQSGSWVFRWFDWIEDKDLIGKTLETAERILDCRSEFSEEAQAKIQAWYAELPKGNLDGIH